MKADILTTKMLFQKDVRYVIPTFQRPYVWNQEDQWEPLWEDVQNTAEEYLEQLDKLGEDKRPEAEKRTGSHFLGAVVLQQQATATAELETRSVIDGQQRLVTLQLLLHAAQVVFREQECLKAARLVSKLIFNDKDYAESDPDYVLKVWPTLVDRDAFRHVVYNQSTDEDFDDSLIVQAYEFFKSQVRQWLGEQPESKARRAEALVTTLMGLINMVVIDLGPEDDANIIFETLNARGTPLLDSDLIKNSILHMASQAGLDSEAIYRQYWKEFDQKWWREEERQGRLVRPRTDIFLNYWLAMRTGEEIRSTRFFPKFLEYAEQRNRVDEVARDIKQIGEVFQNLRSIDDWSPEGCFLYRWRVMEAGVTTPVMLWLFSNRNQIPTDRFYRSLRAIESYLVRRMVCRMTTKDYNKLFLELLRRLREGRVDQADEITVSFLDEETADARVWPSDNRVRDALVSLPLYNLLTRRRLRMVLEGLEDALRTPKTEEEHVRRGALTIEHIMPRDWSKNWPLGEAEDETDRLERIERRNRIIHTIGNLTLVNKKLNPALSNAPWPVKKRALEEHSVLQLNRLLLAKAGDTWDEAAIERRSHELADLFMQVWPSPSALK